MEYILSPTGELYHHGIKDMKWGRRRYQNKDGSLTPEGRKRYSKGDGSESAKNTKSTKSKKLSEMSDDEIRTAIARKQLENQYKQYHPEPATKERFTKKFFEDAVKPAVTDAGKTFIKNALTKFGEKALSDKVSPDSLEGIKKANEKLRAQIEHEWLKRGFDPNIKWDAAEKWRKARDASNAEDAAERARQQADEDARQEAARRSQTRQDNRDAFYRNFTFEGVVEDNPNHRSGSSNQSSRSRSGRNSRTTVDAEDWSYVMDSDNGSLSIFDPRSTTYSNGRRYVAGLLGHGGDDD